MSHDTTPGEDLGYLSDLPAPDLATPTTRGKAAKRRKPERPAARKAARPNAQSARADHAAGKAPKPERAEANLRSPSALAWPGPAKPSAMLVPRYIRERRDTARTQRQALLSVFAFLVGLATVTGWFFHAASAAADFRTQAESDLARAQAESARLAPIADYYDGLVTRRAASSAAMANDLDYAALLAAVFDAGAKAGTPILGVTVAPQASCSGGDPFTPTPAIGCIRVAAQGSESEKVSRLVDALNDHAPLLADAYAPTFSTADEAQTFTVTVNYTVEALTLRFVPEDQREQVKTAAQTPIDPATGLPVVPTPVG